MSFDEFFRVCRRGIAQFACGFLYCGLDSSILFFYRLLARGLLLAYPCTELLLLNPSQREVWPFLTLCAVTLDMRRPRSASLSFSVSSRVTYRVIVSMFLRISSIRVLPWLASQLHRGS